MWSKIPSLQPIFKLCPKGAVRSAVQRRPKLPLYLRPASFRATVSDLKLWHDWAKNQAASVGSAFPDLDNGPDSDLLRREINWLIQDAVETPELILSSSRDGDAACLRTSLADLYELWRQRIEERRPFQYLVGCEHWRDLVLCVEEGVLIPRPETEMIVDLVTDAVNENEDLKEGFWADLGTGSGALAIGLALNSGCCRVIATDLSAIAISVASFNVERYNLQDKITVKQGSWFDPLTDLKGRLSGIVSNPPYIPSSDIDGLQAEVSKHEPRMALDGGADGMDDLIRLCDGASEMLKHGGFFAFETNGEKQCNFVADYVETKAKGSFRGVRTVADFAGMLRFVTGYRL